MNLLRSLFAMMFLAAWCTGFAQVWCPPGAAWVYNISDPTFSTSYNRFTYVGDTVVDGFVGQRIAQQGVMTEIWGSDTLILLSGPDVVTRTEPGIVFWWMENVQEWDTLYWFGAQIGDRWSPGWQQGSDQWNGVCDEGSYLQVLGVDTTVNDGHELRTLAMGMAHDGYVVDMFTIVERMGNTTGYFIPRPTYCMVDECLCSFSCYRDDQINSPSGGPCELPLAVSEHASGQVPGGWMVFPMPFADRFTLHGPVTVRQGEVSLLDITGRELLRVPFQGSLIEVDANGLPGGIYLLRIQDGQGRSSHRKVIKE